MRNAATTTFLIFIFFKILRETEEKAEYINYAGRILENVSGYNNDQWRDKYTIAVIIKRGSLVKI